MSVRSFQMIIDDHAAEVFKAVYIGWRDTLDGARKGSPRAVIGKVYNVRRVGVSVYLSFYDSEGHLASRPEWEFLKLV